MVPFRDTLAVMTVGGLVATGIILMVATKWRLKVLALFIQYLLVVLLLTRIIRVELAAVKGLVGVLICAVFYMTERRVGSPEPPVKSRRSQREKPWHQEMLSAKGWFYLIAAVLVAIIAFGAALRLPLPVVPAEITLAFYMLAGLGLLLVGLNDNPFDVGLGLLTILSGFDLFYVGLEPSLALSGLVGALGFMIALATAYLRSAQVTAREEDLAL